MEFKNSRTAQNLLSAFGGESMARNKYLFFAEKARQEGYTEVAELYERMAQNEGVHGKLLFQHLNGISTTSNICRHRFAQNLTSGKPCTPNSHKLRVKKAMRKLPICLKISAKLKRTMNIPLWRHWHVCTATLLRHSPRTIVLSLSMAIAALSAVLPTKPAPMFAAFARPSARLNRRPSKRMFNSLGVFSV